MIQGIGTDIIEITRVNKTFCTQERLKRVFTSDEMQYFQKKHFSSETVAGRFAAKEACLKALGLSLSFHRMIEISIVQGQNSNKPIVELSDFCKDMVDSGVLWVSISHEKQYATAVAIWED